MNTAPVLHSELQQNPKLQTGGTQPPSAVSAPRYIVHVELELADLHGGQRFAFIDRKRITIGRGAKNDVSLPQHEQSVSSAHAELVQTAMGYVLRDADSRNGLYVLRGTERVPVRELALEIAAPPIEIGLGSPGPTCRLWTGRVYPFANYLVTGHLGEGGMARVFAAQDGSGLNRLVVLKIIASRFLLSVDEGDAESMLAEEARILSQISHPNVVKIYRVDDFEGTPYIEMEYVQGINLSNISQQLLQRQLRCPIDLAAALIQQVCHGLHAAHEARDACGRPLQVVHRDVSPQNIMCTPEGEVKVIDFGVARALGQRAWSSRSLFVGKAAYAAPEQIARPAAVDRRSDLFAAGVVLYELIAGRSPFHRGSDYWTMHAVMYDPAPPIDGLPPDVCALLARVLAKDPEERPQTAEQLAAELESIVARHGGEYLKRKNIVHGLRRLGVCMDSPAPRSLQVMPSVFPLPSHGQTQRPQAKSTAASPRAVAQDQLTAKLAAGASPQEAALPQRLVLPGQELTLGQRLDEYLAPGPDAYGHLILATSSAEKRVHLIGPPGLSGPLPARYRARLDELRQRWLSKQGGSSPLADLLMTAEEAWPRGPYALVVRAPGLLWADALNRSSPHCKDPTALCVEMVRALAAACQIHPGFTHGELDPLQVALTPKPEDATQLIPQLLLGRWLDWLLAEQRRPLPAVELLPLDRALYLAPECRLGAPPSPASDVFSAAMMAYELFGGNLTAAVWALRQGGRVPPLPPSTSCPTPLQEALLAALSADPQRRPVVAELCRLCETSVEPSKSLLTLQTPPPSEVRTTQDSEGRRVILHTLRILRHGQRGPTSLPLVRVPHLLPAGIGLLRFREGLAVELVDALASDVPRPRLYPERSHTGSSRVFLGNERGAFELGSRGQNRLQLIEYQVASANEAQVIDIPSHNLRILSAPLPCVAVLWTREPRSGDLHVCCAQAAD